MSGEELAAAVRELVEEVVGRAAPDEAIADALRDVRAATRRLRGSDSAPPTAAGFDPGDPFAYRRRNPVCGVLNPLAPPVRYGDAGSDIIEGTVVFGPAYQGPPGYVHGAFIAGVFDDVLGAANLASGHPGMTVKLEVRYRRPTPLGVPVRLVARHTGRDGRRIFASATMLAGDDVTAEAEGVFAQITWDRARRLFADHLRAGEEP